MSWCCRMEIDKNPEDLARFLFELKSRRQYLHTAYLELGGGKVVFQGSSCFVHNDSMFHCSTPNTERVLVVAKMFTF